MNLSILVYFVLLYPGSPVAAPETSGDVLTDHARHLSGLQMWLADDEWLSQRDVLRFLYDREEVRLVSVGRIDAVTGRFRKLPKLTAYLRAAGFPYWYLSPDCQWMLWTDLSKRHGYGCKLDGSRRFRWQPHAFRQCTWAADSRQWAEFVLNPARKLRTVYLHDREHPESPRRIAVPDPHPLNDGSVDAGIGGAVFTKDGRIVARCYGAKYDSRNGVTYLVVDLKKRGLPYRFLPVTLPPEATYYAASISPDGSRVAWAFDWRSGHGFLTPQAFERMFPGFQPEGKRIWSIHVSRLGETGFFPVGYTAQPEDIRIHILSWLPDGEHLSFSLDWKPYSTPVRPNAVPRQ